MAAIDIPLRIIEHFTYIGAFGILAFLHHFIPLPEEIILVTAGYAAAFGYANVFWLTLVVTLGVLVSDNTLYWLSRKGSSHVKVLKDSLHTGRLSLFKKKMEQNTIISIFFFRFIPGLRLVSPIMAGSIKVKWLTFQIVDAIAVLIYVSLFIFLGFHFHKELDLILHGLKIARLIIFGILLVIISFVAVYIAQKVLGKQSRVPPLK